MQEKGICILCGGEKKGVAAKGDAAISLARKIRRLFGRKERHTIACSACIPLCKGRRAAFERYENRHRQYAALFFAFVIVGGMAFGRLEPLLIIPATAGAMVIYLVSFGSYFPSFDAVK